MADILIELREPLPKVEGYSGEYVDEDAVLSIFKDAADEIELMRHALACVVLYWDEWKDAPADHPTALSLEEVVDMCRAHLGEKE